MIIMAELPSSSSGFSGRGVDVEFVGGVDVVVVVVVDVVVVVVVVGTVMSQEAEEIVTKILQELLVTQ